MYVERRIGGQVLRRSGEAAPTDFAQLFKALFNAIDERHPEGGMHGAAMVRDDAIVFIAQDVGRHNAVDKAIGKVLLAGELPERYGMIVTSRVSGEIARKCARSGVAWLASRSIPTSLALVEAGDMPIIARATRSQ
jgi:FdhD protein